MRLASILSSVLSGAAQALPPVIIVSVVGGGGWYAVDRFFGDDALPADRQEIIYLDREAETIEEIDASSQDLDIPDPMISDGTAARAIRAYEEDEHILGPVDARFSLVMYASIPSRLTKLVYPEAIKFISDHEDRNLIFRHYPNSKRKLDWSVGQISECLASDVSQEAFWNYLAALLDGEEQVSISKSLEIAQELGLSEQRAIECSKDEESMSIYGKVFLDYQHAWILGDIQGAPTMVFVDNELDKLWFVDRAVSTDFMDKIWEEMYKDITEEAEDAEESEGVPEDCGNGVIDEGETCDDGGTCDVIDCPDTAICYPTAECTTIDLPDLCGTDPAACKPVSGDGCSATCQEESGTGESDSDDHPTRPPEEDDENDEEINPKGDGERGEGESTDESEDSEGSGDSEGRDSSASSASLALSSEASSETQVDNSLPVCGNNIRESGEDCDDGNTDNDDGCSANCQLVLEHSCGNGTVESLLSESAERRKAGAIAAYLRQIDADGSLDVDDSGASDALSDGILITRYFAGFRGEDLIQGAVEPSAERKTADDIAAYIEDQIAQFDFDLDGSVDAVVDAGLIFRYLFEFTGTVLVGEECDDGNTEGGDGCDDRCGLEYHNINFPTDINNDGARTPLDLLLVIDLLTKHYSGIPVYAPAVSTGPELFYDVNNDGFITTIDAQIVIDGIQQDSQSPFSSAPTEQSSSDSSAEQASSASSLDATDLYQNQNNFHDVNGDGSVSTVDALLIIELLQDNGAGIVVSDLEDHSPPFFDVNGDSVITALDAHIVINKLNQQAAEEFSR